MVAVILLIPSCAIVLGHVSVILIWRAGEDAPTEAETLLRLSLPLTNVLSTGVWFAYVLTPPVGKDRGPPKPQVASFVVRDVDSECRVSTCAICLEEFSYGCLAGKLPCEHVYHYYCLSNWLDRGHSQARCPMRCSSATSPDLGGRMIQRDQSEIGRGLHLAM
jgi:hypothetical protein